MARRARRLPGIQWDSLRGLWAAFLYEPGPPKRNVRIAHFDDQLEAALARERVLLFVHGADARRSFPRRKLAPASIEEIRREARRSLKRRRMTSGWDGVYRHSGGRVDRPWGAELLLPSGQRRATWLGNFATELQAAMARDRAALFYAGAAARLNLPHLAHRLEPASVRVLRAEAAQAWKAATTSRFRGVIWAKKLGCWRARITVDGELRHLGLFTEEEDAARAYDGAARKARGARATLNFPR